MFRRDGYDGTESTFGLGGPYDQGLDGAFYQWQSLTRQADAQGAGNAYATSIECSDGGVFTRPLSDKQIEASIQLGIWWCKQTGVAPKKITSWDGPGLGYHRMFKQWNPNGHECPGDVRAEQLEKVVWPAIARGIVIPSPNPTPPAAQWWPKFPLADDNYYGVGGIYHADSLKTWQRQMAARKWKINVNGYADDNCTAVAKAFQKEKGLGVDGRIGRNTWNAAWTAKIT